MATELALERDDKGPIGPFNDVQTLIRDVFPSAQFGWTQSGREKLKLAAERGIELPVALRESLESLPALLDGRFRDESSLVTFGLGYQEPVKCLYVTPSGESPEFQQRLSQLEAKVGGRFVVSGEATNRATRTES